MGDMGDIYNDLKDHRRRLREMFGVECPRCKTGRPKTNASILLSQQVCKVDRYRDPRPHLTDADHQKAEGEIA